MSNLLVNTEHVTHLKYIHQNDSTVTVLVTAPFHQGELEDLPEVREIQVVSSSPPWPRLDLASLIWPERFAHYTIAALLVRICTVVMYQMR